MSRIGKKPVVIPKGVNVELKASGLTVKGPKGSLSRDWHQSVSVSKVGDELVVSSNSKSNLDKRFHGLERTLIANMLIGCGTGFVKSLSLVGVGYRAAAEGKGITLSLGYSHPIKVQPIEGIEFVVEKATTVHVKGASKELVGEVASKIRGMRPPEPYHGKGVRYIDEVIQTKVGKASGKK